MKILNIITTSSMAYTFLLPFSIYLRDHGYDVSFACSGESFADAPSRVKELIEAGFTVHEIPFAREINAVQDTKTLTHLIPLIRNGNYDIVHTHASKAGFIGRFAAKLAGCKSIFHTVWGFYFREFDSGLKRRFLLGLEKLSAIWCDKMLFISEALYDEAVQYRMKAQEHLATVGLGINIANFEGYVLDDPTAVKQQFLIEDSNLRVSSVGRLVSQKGMDTLIRAAALVIEKHPNVQFVIAGDGPLKTELIALIDSLGITENVRFVGHLEHNDVLRLMSVSDIFALSTRHEGLGVVYLEAMALGCPVVGTRIPPVDQVVQEGDTGLLATKDVPEEFAEAISQLLDSTELRERLGAAGPQHVQQNYDLLQVFERIEVAYRQADVGERGYHEPEQSRESSRHVEAI